uniref:OCIA domain-containing protein n=1 Tax=Strongyloides stercoralis TaxID=6248 RepID=A0A0K0EN08_STRER
MDFNSPNNSTPSYGVRNKMLTREETQWLLSVMDKDDMNRIKASIAECTGGKFFTHGLPFIAISVASAHMSRLVYPSFMGNVRKPILYSGAVIIGQVFAGFYISKLCASTINPQLVEVFEKYKGRKYENPNFNQYSRMGEENVPTIYGEKEPFQSVLKPIYNTEGVDSPKVEAFTDKPSNPKEQRKLNTYYYDSYPPAYMSGTPQGQKKE